MIRKMAQVDVETVVHMCKLVPIDDYTDDAVYEEEIASAIQRAISALECIDEPYECEGWSVQSNTQFIYD